MNVKYINPFIGSVNNVFQTMLAMPVTFGKPHVKTQAENSHDVSGIIGLSGDIVGTVIVSFPKLSALKIASAFAGVTLTEMDENFSDAIGELANMIAGNAKKDLEDYNVNISTPSVIIGTGHQVRATRVLPRLVIPCSTPAGSFVVEVGMKTKEHSRDLIQTGTESVS